MKFRAKDLKQPSLYYVYFGDKSPGDYSFPCIKVFQQDRDYTGCIDVITEFCWQVNNAGSVPDDSKHLLTPYGGKLEIDGGSLAKGIKFLQIFQQRARKENIYLGDLRFKAVIKILHRMRIPRYTLKPVQNLAEAYPRQEFIPRKFQSRAPDYWQALSLVAA